jgi:hypothetical protein
MYPHSEINIVELPMGGAIANESHLTRVVYVKRAKFQPVQING